MANECSNDTTEYTPSETLAELNFRYAQAMLPFAVMLGMLCFHGIVGNLLLISVFFKSVEYKYTNFKIFVIFLATVDLLSCVSLLPMEIDKTRNFFINSNSTCKIKCFLHIFFNSVVILTFFLTCVDQYRKICKPLKYQIWPDQVVKIFFALVLFAIFLSLPAPIMCGVSSRVKSNLNNDNITVYMCSAEKQYQYSMMRYVYKAGLTGVLVGISTAIIVLYVFIMITIMKHNKQELEIMPMENEELEMSIMPSNPTESRKSFNKGYTQLKEIKSSILNEAASTDGQKEDVSNGTIKRVSGKVLLGLRKSVSSGGLPNMTMIWLILTLIFLMTFIINAGLSFLTTSEHELSPTNLLLYQVFYRLYYINSNINPLVYVLLDKRFRESCNKLLHSVRRNFDVGLGNAV